MGSEVGTRLLTSLMLLICLFLPLMSGALTTFGKSNPQNQNQNSPPTRSPLVNARDCRVQSDCAGLVNTSCMANPRNGKLQCLCGDYDPPDNGACKNRYKAVHVPCNDDAECIENAECTQHDSMMGKRCYCREDFIQENQWQCSGCSSICSYPTILLTVLFLLGRLNYI